MSGAALHLHATQVRLGPAVLARAGFGEVAVVNHDAAWWAAPGSSRIVIQLRHPGQPPFAPTRIIPRPAGALVDVGVAVLSPQGRYSLSPTLPRRLGHTLVTRQQGCLRTLDGDLPDLPFGARRGLACPVPDRFGWVWVDGDTAYRRRPSGRISVCAHVPGLIRAWDVGPGGAFWCQAAGALWLAPETGPARRLPLSIEERLGVEIETLAPGDLVFDDAGSSFAPAETPDAPVIECDPRPWVKGTVGPIIGLSPTPLPFPALQAPACVSAADGMVVRVLEDSLEWWTGAGCDRRVPIRLGAAPLAVAGPHNGVVTVLTAQAVLGLQLDGTPAPPRPTALQSVEAGPSVSSTPAGPVWWTAEGGVVPLGAATPP